MIRHVNISVRGVVQGVCFRACTAEQARLRGVAGLVRNEPDGSVYIEAEAEPDVLRNFIDWCRRGPPSATVEDIKVTDAPVASYRSFRITYHR